MELHHTAVKEEAGFSAIEILLSLIIVVLVTFIGYYVYHTKVTADTAYKSVANTANQVAPKSTPTASGASPVKTGQ